MAEQNVKKIRDLESFSEDQPITTEDFLIVASTQGDPVTNKATIQEVIDAYNSSMVEGDPNKEIPDPEDPSKTIKDPELTPGIENDLDGDGEPDEKIDTTPINAGNIEDFLDPNGGIEIVQECRKKGTKEIVDCDDSTAYYKTKKISTTGFEGYPIVRRSNGFLSEAHYYKSGILKEVSYGKGKFLEYFNMQPGMSDWFVSAYEINPNFNATLFATEAEDDFWFYWMEFAPGGKWVYLSPTPKYTGTMFLESFWLWQENIKWFYLIIDHYPWVYINGTFPGSEEEIGWSYLHPTNQGQIWIESLQEWRNINNLSVTSTVDNGSNPTSITGGFPTISSRPLDFVPSNQPSF